MNYESFEPYLGTWGPKLKKFIEGPQCDRIYEYLQKRSREGKTILPSWENTFKAFQKTPFDKLKVIFFLQDPYPWIKDGKVVADGIAMSCSNTKIEQPSLTAFYDALGLSPKERSPDLSYLCEQGVMLLNTALTVELNKPTSHSKVRIDDKKIRLWEPFTQFLLEEVITPYTRGLILVFAGKESQYYEKFVNPLQHYIFHVEHPATAAHQEREWKHEGIFDKIDYLLKQNNNITINWKDGQPRDGS